jgi:hypothetical protein
MLNFANSTLTENKDSSTDTTRPDAHPPRDGGPEVTPLFTAPDDRPDPAPATRAGGPATQEQPVRDQVQRVRLDLLARETERLDLVLEQILEQQKEDRQLREGLQGELANLCQRVDTLIAGNESAAPDGAEAADLRDTVKPLLQAVMQMLDGPTPKPAAPRVSMEPAQAPRPPTRPVQPRQPAAGPEQKSPAAPRITADPMQPSASTARPAGTADTARRTRPAALSGEPQAQSEVTPIDDVEARAMALHKALARLDMASRPTARTQPRHPGPAPAPKAAMPRSGPSAALAGPAPGTRAESLPGDGPAQKGVLSKAPEIAPKREARPALGLPTPKPEPDSTDDAEDSLGAEDPTIEIARLLRPVEARTEARAAEVTTGRRPEPTAPPPASRTAGQSELLLGTSETPEIAGRPARPSERPGPGDGPVKQAGAGQAPMASGAMRPAADASAPDRPASVTSSPPVAGQDRGAPAGTRLPEKDTALQGGGPPSGLDDAEPAGPALPRCLTEPWDDADGDLSWLQAGQDKSSRRWPFRRARSTGEAADQQGESRSTSKTDRTNADGGTERRK